MTTGIGKINYRKHVIHITYITDKHEKKYIRPVSESCNTLLISSGLASDMIVRVNTA